MERHIYWAHKFEFAKDRNERNRLATKYQNERKERRRYKNICDEYKILAGFINSDNNKGALKRLKGLIQHIDLSIKKHGWYTDDNLCGWKIGFMNCPESELDKKEQHYIKMYAKHGYQLRNKTAGGQGQGKTQIDAYRPAKGYRDGIAQGKKTLARELSHIIDKHLTVTLQDGKEYNKVSQKAMEKFNALLDEKNY